MALLPFCPSRLFKPYWRLPQGRWNLCDPGHTIWRQRPQWNRIVNTCQIQTDPLLSFDASSTPRSTFGRSGSIRSNTKAGKPSHRLTDNPAADDRVGLRPAMAAGCDAIASGPGRPPGLSKFQKALGHRGRFVFPRVTHGPEVGGYEKKCKCGRNAML